MKPPPVHFAQRNAVLATMHRKEQVMKAPLEQRLGLRCTVPEGFDTDRLGTFTGERERQDDALITLRKKCRMAMAQYQFDLGLASEGSFGPHPFIPFVPADEEWVMLIDERNEIELVAREISTKTNYAALDIETEEALLAFAKRAGFPSHGLILRTSKQDYSEQIKGIRDWHTLTASFNYIRRNNGSVYIETDMRAMHNPTRMRVIQRATRKLIQQALSACPNCKMPGFAVSEAKSGLPCAQCRQATQSTLYHVYRCQKCQFEKEVYFPLNKRVEDPMFCAWCNP